jgi:hypothetical protein
MTAASSLLFLVPFPANFYQSLSFIRGYTVGVHTASFVSKNKEWGKQE